MFGHPACSLRSLPLDLGMLCPASLLLMSVCLLMTGLMAKIP